MIHHRRARLGLALLVAAIACTAKVADPMDLGVRSFEAQDYAEAAAHFAEVLTSEPENARALYFLGRIALQSGDIDGAVEKLEKATALEGANSEYHFRLGVAYAQKIQKVSFMEKAEIAPKLKGEFEKAVEADPENVEARMALAQYYLNAPPMVGGSTEKAMEQVDAIKGLDPLRGHLFMARIHSAKKNYDDAEGELKAAVELSPEDTDVRYQLGILYQTKEDYAAAFEAFEGALEIDPGYGRALYQIGRTAVFSGDNLERGVACLTAYLQNEPDAGQPTWAHAHWRLGMIYEKMGDVERARKAYQSALELDPEVKGAREGLDRL